jgi:5-(carboxyamino)imidazole ribonucleotide synthase
LGPDGFEGKYKPVQLENDDAYLKMYGKNVSKPQRKLGHFNVVDLNDTKDVSELLEMVDEIKNSILIKQLA